MAEKPPIIVRCEEDRGNNFLVERLQAQRDADIAYYELLIQQAKEEVARKIKEGLLTNGLLEIGRKAIEDVLVDWRNNRLSEPFRGNGLVIKEKNGKDSHIIRFGPETALQIGIKAMLQSLKSKYLSNPESERR